MSRRASRSESCSSRSSGDKYGQYSTADLASAIESTLKPRNLTLPRASQEFSVPVRTIQRARDSVYETLANSPMIERKTRIYQDLLKEGVILRPLSAYQLPQHLRMSVGLMDENRAAITALKKVLGLSNELSSRESCTISQELGAQP